MVSLFASVRHDGKSISLIAETEIGKAAGSRRQFRHIFHSGPGPCRAFPRRGKCHDEEPLERLHHYRHFAHRVYHGCVDAHDKTGDIVGGSTIGVVLLALVILSGPYVASHPEISKWFYLSQNQCAVFIPVYGFVASALPVWLLLCPRDYLSTYLKLGTIGALAVGIFLVHPNLQMAPLTKFISGGGPLVTPPGSVFPFLFITIACGALSGFHSLIGSGTTPKMINNERDILFVGYGAMLVEGFVAIMALVAACVLVPSDYFAINTSAEAYKTLGMTPVHLPELAQSVQENIQGGPGGAVSLAVGMAYIFGSVRIHEGADIILVSFCDHVRGRFHPDRRGHRNTGGKIPAPGNYREGHARSFPKRDGYPALSSPAPCSPLSGDTWSTPAIFERSGRCSA